MLPKGACVTSKGLTYWSFSYSRTKESQPKKNTYKNPQLRDDTGSPFGPPSFCLLKLNLFKIKIDIHFLRIDQSFLKHHFLCHTSVPPRCGPAAPGSWRPLMVWSSSGSSGTRRSRLVGATAGADCWATGFCLQVDCQGCLFRYLIQKPWSSKSEIFLWGFEMTGAAAHRNWLNLQLQSMCFVMFRVFLLFTHGRRTIISRYPIRGLEFESSQLIFNWFRTVASSPRNLWNGLWLSLRGIPLEYYKTPTLNGKMSIVLHFSIYIIAIFWSKMDLRYP